LRGLKIGSLIPLVEIPSFAAGLIAFVFIFLLMGVMFFVLREESDKTMPTLNTVGPTDMAKSENVLASLDAPFLAVVTLVMLEIVVDAVIVVSVLQGAGTFATGTMLAIATFLAAAILAVYRNSFMSDEFVRKPRLEKIASRFFQDTDKSEAHD
jgi:hypothetical protein